MANKYQPGCNCCGCAIDWLIRDVIAEPGQLLTGNASKPWMVPIDPEDPASEKVESFETLIVTEIKPVNQLDAITAAKTAAQQALLAALSGNPTSITTALTRLNQYSVSSVLDDAWKARAAAARDALTVDEALFTTTRNAINTARLQLDALYATFYTNTVGGVVPRIVNAGNADDAQELIQEIHDQVIEFTEIWNPIKADFLFIQTTTTLPAILQAIERAEGLVGKVAEGAALLATADASITSISGLAIPSAVEVVWEGLEVTGDRTRIEGVTDHKWETEILANEAPWTSGAHRTFNLKINMLDATLPFTQHGESKELLLTEVQLESAGVNVISHRCDSYEEGEAPLPTEYATIAVQLPDSNVAQYEVNVYRSKCLNRNVRHPVPFTHRRWRSTNLIGELEFNDGMTQEMDIHVDIDRWTAFGGLAPARCCHYDYQLYTSWQSVSAVANGTTAGEWTNPGFSLAIFIDQPKGSGIDLEALPRSIYELPMNEWRWWEFMKDLRPYVPNAEATPLYRQIQYGSQATPIAPGCGLGMPPSSDQLFGFTAVVDRVRHRPEEILNWALFGTNTLNPDGRTGPYGDMDGFSYRIDQYFNDGTVTEFLLPSWRHQDPLVVDHFLVEQDASIKFRNLVVDAPDDEPLYEGFESEIALIADTAPVAVPPNDCIPPTPRVNTINGGYELFELSARVAVRLEWTQDDAWTPDA
jgi:hypothetical protein